ncbi:hypothetical protein G5B00_07930 [Parapedobacter sp. SGR-10]|nr:hypothetical protein [Parapedobacter sp. SGR-10]
MCLFSSVFGSLYAQNKTREIIRDPAFQHGLMLSPLDPDSVRKGGGFARTFRDTLRFDKNTAAPAWRLHQWHSKYSLEKTVPATDADGNVVYENEGKKVSVSRDNALLLEIKTSREWDSPRGKGEHWPHLLIAQDFPKKFTVIGELEKLLFTVEVKLEKCENKMEEGTFNPRLHTAHTPLYFVVRNDNKQSADYGQKIWLGIHSFDYRYPELKHQDNLRKDKGTSSYMYNIPPKDFWGDVSFNDHQWHRGNVDLLPYIIQAVETVQKKDIFKNSTLDDLRVTGMNFGWEVPGIFDAAVRIKNLSLRAVYK